jgi:uncharacterized membrane protein YkoI
MKWIAIPIVAAALATPAVAAKTVPGFIGATRAVEIAEQAVGGQVLEVELDHRRNRTVYELELVKDDALHEVDIDARSGKVVARRTPVVQGYWKRFKDADEFREAGRARPLSELLHKLERSSGGQVVDASFEIERGQARYEVEIVTAAGKAELYLDPQTGRRLAFVLDD